VILPLIYLVALYLCVEFMASLGSATRSIGMSTPLRLEITALFVYLIFTVSTQWAGYRALVRNKWGRDLQSQCLWLGIALDWTVIANREALMMTEDYQHDRPDSENYWRLIRPWVKRAFYSISAIPCVVVAALLLLPY